MTASVIVGIFVLLIVLLLSLHLKLDIAMLDELTIHVGAGPILVTLTPKKNRTVDPNDFTYEKHQKRLAKDRKRALKKAQKKAKRNAVKAEKKALERQKESQALLDGEEKKKFPLDFILALIKFVFHELGVFAGYFHTEVKALHVTVGGKDAAAVGKTYGYLSQSVEYLLTFLSQRTHMKQMKPNSVSVKADFLLEKTEYRIHIRLKLSVFSIVRVGCHAIGWFIKRKITESKRNIA